MTAATLVVGGSLTGLIACACGVSLPRSMRVATSAVLVWVACALEAAADIHVIASGHPIVLHSTELLPPTGTDIVLTPLGAFFRLPVALAAVPSILHGIGYASHGLDSRLAAGAL